MGFAPATCFSHRGDQPISPCPPVPGADALVRGTCITSQLEHPSVVKWSNSWLFAASRPFGRRPHWGACPETVAGAVGQLPARLLAVQAVTTDHSIVRPIAEMAGARHGARLHVDAVHRRAARTLVVGRGATISYRGPQMRGPKVGALVAQAALRRPPPARAGAGGASIRALSTPSLRRGRRRGPKRPLNVTHGSAACATGSKLISSPWAPRSARAPPRGDSARPHVSNLSGLGGRRVSRHPRSRRGVRVSAGACAAGTPNRPASSPCREARAKRTSDVARRGSGRRRPRTGKCAYRRVLTRHPSSS